MYSSCAALETKLTSANAGPCMLITVIVMKMPPTNRLGIKSLKCKSKLKRHSSSTLPSLINADYL